MFVKPKVYLFGYTEIDYDGARAYLRASGCEAFLPSMVAAEKAGLSDGEILCSLYAKVCYSALKVGDNLNVSRVRDIPDNLAACFDQGHGSVFEHANVNFMVRNCSRVLTHELVRHRAGTAFSQTSGRYVRRDRLDMVTDLVLEQEGIFSAAEQEEMRKTMEGWMHKANQRMEGMADFARKKRATSAVRRFLPNGQANDIGFSANIRAIRHIVQTRTSRHAEAEIRDCFAQVYYLLVPKFPLLFHGAKAEVVDGILEVSGMRMQPYDR